MPGTTELVGLGMDALQTYFGKLQTELKLVRTRTAPSKWHYALMEGIKSSISGSPDDLATWAWENPRKNERIAVKRIQVILDDEPSDTYHPAVQIAMNDVRIIRTKNNALKVADLDLDFGDGGKYLEPGYAITVNLWNELDDETPVTRRATVYVQVGEA